MGYTQFLNIDILKIKLDLRNRHTRLGLLAIPIGQWHIYNKKQV